MEAYSANVLVDILTLCFISIAIALPLYHYIRKLQPELAWNHHGNVSTTSISNIDLIGIFAASLIYTASVLSYSSAPQIDTQELNRIPNISKFLLGLLSQAIPVAITCAFLMPRTEVLGALGLKRPPSSRIILTSIIGLFSIYLLIALSSIVTTPLLEKNLGKQELQAPVQMILDAKQNNPTLLIYLAILTVIVAPLCEEFVFRGYIYATLKKFSCRLFAATTSALFFAVVHTNLWSIIPLFIVGYILALLYEISGSLWTAILTHAMFNGVTTYYLIFHA